MARIVGYVKAVEGTFYAKGPDGRTRELKEGDPVYARDFVYDPTHDTSHRIVIDLTQSSEDLRLDGNAELVFDETVTDTRYVMHEALTEADVVSSLRETEQGTADAIDDLLKSFGDIDVDETAAGDERVQPRSAAYTDRFATENGAEANVQSDLRAPASHDYTLDVRTGLGAADTGTGSVLTGTVSPAANLPGTGPTPPTVLPPLPPQTLPPADIATSNTIAIVDPNGDGYIDAQEAAYFTLTGTVEPGSAIDAILVSDGITTITVPPSAISYNPETGLFRVTGVDLSSLRDGPITTSVTSTDAAGNSATSTATAVKDTTPPSLSVEVPAASHETTPTITGHSSEADSGVTLEITAADGTTQTIFITTDEHGDFRVTLPNPLPEGPYEVKAEITDKAGNRVTVEEGGVIDMTTPEAPTVQISEDSDDDGFINAQELKGEIDVRVGLPATAAPGDTLVVTDGVSRFEKVLDADDVARGYVTTEFAAPPEGSEMTVTAQIVDAAGNVGPAASDTARLDTQAEAAIDVDPVTGDNVLNAAEAGRTIEVTGHVGGDAKPGDTVVLTVGGQRFEGTVDANLDYTVAVPGEVLAGATAIEAEVTGTDAAGNPYSASVTHPYAVDTEAPALAIALDPITPDDTINAAEAGETIRLGGSVSGDFTPEDTVVVTVDGKEYTAHPDAEGRFEVEVPGSVLADAADFTVDARITAADAVGNETTARTERAYTVDTTPPQLSVSLDPVTPDNTINAEEAQGEVAVTGRVSDEFHPGDTVTLTLGDRTYTATVGDDGSFRVSVPGDELAGNDSGTLEASVTVTDAAGNSATATATQSYAVDTTPPGAPTVTIVEDADDNGLIGSKELDGDIDVKVALPADAKAGDTLHIGDGRSEQTVVLSEQQIADGYVATTFPPPEEGAAIDVTAYLTDPAGNRGAAASDSAVLDTTPPGAPTVTIVEDSDNDGYINAGELQGEIDVRIDLPADAEVGDTLRIANPDGTLSDVTVDQGMLEHGYTLSYPRPEEGVRLEVGAQLVDRAGNAGPVAGDSAVLDTTAPTVTVDAPATTRDTTPVITGHAAGVAAGAIVTLTITDADGNEQQVETTVDADGNYRADVPASLPEGAFEVKAVVSDEAGNRAEAVDTGVVDTTPPAEAPVVTITEDADNDGLINARESDGEVKVHIDLDNAAAGDTLHIVGPDGTATDVTITDEMIARGYDLTYRQPAEGETVSVQAQYIDPAGNAGPAGEDRATLDTVSPTLQIAVDDAALSKGETATVTFTFSEPVKGFEAGDVQVAGGTLSDLTRDPDDPTKWTATFTPADDYEGEASIEVADGSYTDLAGNPGLGADETLAVDTKAPVPTITLDPDITSDDVINLAESHEPVTVTGTVGGDAKAGDTVTLTVNGNDYTGTVEEENGRLRFAIEVPGGDLAADGDRTIDASVTTVDAAGNRGTATTSEGYAVDTTPPTVQVSVDDEHLTRGEIAEVVFDFSEPPVGFGAEDIRVTGGTLSDLTQDPDDPTKWTATFTPDADYEGEASVEVIDGSYTDAAQNVGSGAEAAFEVNTKYPDIQLDKITGDNYVNATEAGEEVAITGSVKGPFKEGDTVVVTVNGNEYTATVDGNNNFRVDVPGSELVDDGDHSVEAKVISADNPKDTDSTGISYIVDTEAPSAPTVTIAEDTDDNGYINAAELQGDVDVEVGLPDDAKAGDTLTVTDGTATQTIELSDDDIRNGTLKTSFAAPAEGTEIRVEAYVTDRAGNTGPSASDSAVLDTTVPGVSITFPEDADGNGYLTQSEFDGDVSVRFNLENGTEAGDVLHITNPDGTVETVTVTEEMLNEGYYEKSYPAADGDTLAVSAYVDDAAGNRSATASDEIRIDTTTDLTFVKETAGYANVVGIYEVGEDGRPVSGQVLIDDQNKEQAGEILATLDPSKTYHFFIIANGASEVTIDSTITFDNDGQYPVMIADGNTITHPVYYTNPDFNRDDHGDHFKMVADDDGQGTTVYIEDLPTTDDAEYRYDGDFEDVVLHADIPLHNEMIVTAGIEKADDGTRSIVGKTEPGATVGVYDADGNRIGEEAEADIYGAYKIDASDLDENQIHELTVVAKGTGDGEAAATFVMGSVQDDRLTFDPDAIVDGGAGDDTLIVSENIDFSRLEDYRVEEIEKIDLTDSKAEELTKLTLEEVIELTDDRNTLVIDGDAADKVDVPDAEGSYTVTRTTEGGYDVYTYSSSDGDPTVTLKIDQDIQHG